MTAASGSIRCSSLSAELEWRPITVPGLFVANRNLPFMRISTVILRLSAVADDFAPQLPDS